MTLLDSAVLILYFSVLIAVGYFTGRGEKTTEGYFLGNRKMPWWAVCCSILGTEMSAATFIGVPSQLFKFDEAANSWGLGGNFGYLQFALGSIIGRLLIASFLLPAYYHHKVTTVYELLYHRFGRPSQLAGTLFFFASRMLASGVRLFIIAFAISVVSPLSVPAAVALVALAAAAYTILGGIKAVIWTDVIQVCLFIGGAFLSLYFIGVGVPGGWTEILSLGKAADSLKVIDTTFSFKPGFTLWAGLFSGTIGTMAGLGADQDLTQRMLTCKNLRESRMSLVLTGFIGIPVVALFLMVGLGLAVFFQFNPGPQLAAGRAAHFYPWFIVNVLPSGVKGLLLAAMFAAAMSSMDSALNALSTSFITDIYRPYFNAGAEESFYLRVSRISVAVFAVLLVGVALLCSLSQENVLVLALRLPGYTLGGILGVLLTAVLTRRGSNKGNLTAMLTSVVFTVWLGWTGWVGFGWLIVFGTAWTLAISSSFKPARPSGA